ncbi:MAG: hypothetical protein IPK53_11765 [bacterium]|nr:hypothetical protein [bacterium]
MLQRQPIQARYEFEIPGITNELCFSDIQIQNDNDDDCAARLDRLQFQAQGASIGETSESDDDIESGENDRFGLQEPTFEMDDVDSEESNRHNHMILEEAFKSLTDRQAAAVQLWVNGMSERTAADFMGIKQATYQEMLWGKNNIGGAIPKLRKHFQKHPVTS